MPRSGRNHLLTTAALATIIVTGAFVLWPKVAETPTTGSANDIAETAQPATPQPTLAAEPSRDVAQERISGEVTATVPSPPLPAAPQPEASGATTAFTAIPNPVPQPRFDTEDGPITALEIGLDAVSAGSIDEARAAREALPERSLDRHVLAWAIALKGGAGVNSQDIADAALALPDWPGAKTLRRNLERALFREEPDAATVVKGVGATEPLTAEGAIALVRAQLSLGNSDAAKQTLSTIWRTAPMDASRESLILEEFGSLLDAADHRYRMERMLFADRVKSAARVAKPAGAEALFNAWSAVVRGDRNAGKLLDAVPDAQRSAGFFYAKAKYLRARNKISEAAEVALQAPRDKASFADPDAWWTERRLLSRKLLDAGKAMLAYKVAAIHAAESPTAAAEAEFHAGWYALRWLKDPAVASRHFARIAEITEGPISRSRAYYWLGRAADAGGPGNATGFYEKAAAYGTAFYGQLAAAKLGQAKLNVAYPEPTAADRTSFASREAVRAIQRLEAAGATGLAGTLYIDLANDLTSPGELALLAAMAEGQGNHYLALKVGKAAAQRGLDIGALSHPMGVIPASADISGSGKALAYAIARQESEFNIGAVSQAGALGLLQLMPGTAAQMAKKAGLTYSEARLTTDAGYNAALGAAFLGQQLARFDGSYVLTFAGYNAGPRRSDEWIRRYGDPRGKSIEEVVDWIERIPFTETRSYVQRVMENYEVYKMRISGTSDIVGDLRNGRR